MGFFAAFWKIIAQGWNFSTIYLSQRSGFGTFFVPGGREFALSNKIPGGLPGERGMVSLGID